jgi:restriction system protein
MKEYLSFIKSALEQQGETKALDPSPLMDAAVKKYGRAGLKIVFELIKGTNRDLHRSAWGTMRTTEWKDEVELNELFTSEKLDTLHGRFFD